MTDLILLYSLTGRTRALGQGLADELNADIAEITCARYSRGIQGFVMAGYDSLRGHLPEVTLSTDADLSRYDRLLIGSPIWAGSLATPVLSFLSAAPKLPDDVGLFMTSSGRSPYEKALSQLEGAIGRTTVADVCIRRGALDVPLAQAKFNRFLHNLRQPTQTA